MSHSRRVCLLIDTSTSWGVRLIKGVSRHAHEVGDWLIHVEPWGRYERFRVPQGWKGQGIIARINHEALAKDIAAVGLPRSIFPGIRSAVTVSRAVLSTRLRVVGWPPNIF